MKDCVKPTGCMGRREFLVKAGLTAGGLVLAVSSLSKTIGAAAFEEVMIKISPDSPLAKVGGFQIVDSSAGKLIVVHLEENKFKAYSAICTHKRGLLAYDSKNKVLACPKHGSKFDETSGSVKDGPAESPIALYSANGGEGSVTVMIDS